MTLVGCKAGQARYEVPRVTPRTACPISLMVGYVPVVVVVVVVLSVQRPALVLQNRVSSLAVHFTLGDLQATTTSLSPGVAALPELSLTS